MSRVVPSLLGVLQAVDRIRFVQRRMPPGFMSVSSTWPPREGRRRTILVFALALGAVAVAGAPPMTGPPAWSASPAPTPGG